ncbi:hypothetical protein BU24DRAFT_416502, partial [Aaosphaeria arxii CBS 175.79]
MSEVGDDIEWEGDSEPFLPSAQAPPSLDEIIALTRSELTSSSSQDHGNGSDDIQECGRPALSILSRNPDAAMRLAYQKLHDVPYKDVKTCWRRLYTDAALWKVLGILESQVQINERRDCPGKEDWVTEVVKVLDMALILTGAPSREEVFELIFSALNGVISKEREELQGGGRPPKRRKLDEKMHVQNDSSKIEQEAIPETFPTTINDEPILRFPIPRLSNFSLSAFQSRISDPSTAHQPFVIENAISYWPALSDRPWKKPSYLLSHTLNGRRLVPVEIGRSYTDQGWGQKILSFGDFMTEYMFHDPTLSTTTKTPAHDRKTGYLAQHDLFAQIPSLRADISIPDYCYADPPPPLNTTTPTSPSSPKPPPPQPKLETPLLNAWFGPAGTISPLHTDPYHNILAQVVGSKYLRLYAPSQTASLHPRGVEGNGVDMSNTSRVDLDEAMRVFPDISPFTAGGDADLDEDGEGKREFEARFPKFRDAAYVETVLGPGDCLYIPVGWWHYVRSLTPSFSVSFWF